MLRPERAGLLSTVEEERYLAWDAITKQEEWGQPAPDLYDYTAGRAAFSSEAVRAGLAMDRFHRVAEHISRLSLARVTHGFCVAGSWLTQPRFDPDTYGYRPALAVITDAQLARGVARSGKL
jgi:hypothetical protein